VVRISRYAVGLLHRSSSFHCHHIIGNKPEILP